MKNILPAVMQIQDEINFEERGYQPLDDKINYDPIEQTSDCIDFQSPTTWSSVSTTGTGIAGLDSDPDSGKDD